MLLTQAESDHDADLDRFATLFSPATPPATPILAAMSLPILQPTARPPRPRTSTGSTDSDSDFGAFVSVPPSQDPLAPAQSRQDDASNHSLVYFDRFTASARTAAERNKREVLDELLEHQDDPMYFLDTHPTTPTLTSSSTSDSNSNSALMCPIPIQIPMPMPMSTDDALAEALASEMTNPKLIRIDSGGSVKVAPSPSRSRFPLPPRLSGTASPPSIFTSSTGPISTTSLATASSSSASTPSSASTLASGSHPAHATLSRISSSLVSLLPPASTRPRSTTPTIPSIAPPHVHGTIPRFHAPSTVLTHGSPFSATPYIPPTGAPGFAGDRAWDRGFSEVLEQEEKRGLVDPVGLGVGAGGAGTEMTTHAKHAKGKGVTLVGRREGTVGVLTEETAGLIRPHLPALTKLPRHWTLLYSLDQHGISLNTLYARCEPRVPSRAHPNPPKGGLVVVRDADGAVFGAWVSEGLRVERGGYYGSGEAFLWRYHSPVPLPDDREWERGREGLLDVYNWTGANAYVALCEPGFISFGGGDGHYGLYLGASLLDGSSASCPTFGNPPLCGRGRDREQKGGRGKREVSFECVGLEVWGIGPS